MRGVAAVSYTHLRKEVLVCNFENEKLEPIDPSVEAYITLAGAVAQERSRNISENMQRAIARRFEQGISTNYKAFIGYQCIDGKLDIVPEQEEILNRARPLRTTDGNQISSGKQIAVFVGMWGLQGGFRYRTCLLYTSRTARASASTISATW